MSGVSLICGFLGLKIFTRLADEVLRGIIKEESEKTKSEVLNKIEAKNSDEHMFGQAQFLNDNKAYDEALALIPDLEKVNWEKAHRFRAYVVNSRP